MQRRHFLKLMSRLTAAAGSVALPGIELAQASTHGNVVVIVFLRGGWDGLSVTSPHGDDNYYRLRPTIAVQPPGSTYGSLDLDGFFGLHPAMPELYRMYQDGHVAIFPTVLHNSSVLSHFTAQDIMESASTPARGSGWLARLLGTQGMIASDRAVSLGEKPPLSLAGARFPAPNFLHLTDLSLASNSRDRELLNKVFSAAYAWEPRANNPYAEAIHRIGTALPAEMAALNEIAEHSLPSRSLYPDTLFGTQMRHAAAMIKARENLNIVTMELGGWDTHSLQGSQIAEGKMSQLLADFSNCVSGFFEDLAGAGTQVTLLAVTEFGRTAAENGSFGTDHGCASTWLAIGPNVRGGIYMGNAGWPGLAESSLYDGRALAHTVDFRSIYAEISAFGFGTINESAVFPDFQPEWLGFVS